MSRTALEPVTAEKIAAVPAASPFAVRLDRLNTLRALSILGVFLFHTFSGLFARSAAQLNPLADSISPVERLGLLLLSQTPRLVAIFFLISGYFVHRTFLLWVRRNHAYLAFARFFLWRRFWRLVPPFWCALILSYLTSYKDPLAWASLRKLLVNATLLKTLFPGYFFSINYAHWYVAVQWQLDLLYPIFLYVIWRYSFRTAFASACALAFLTNFVFPHFSSQPYIDNLPFRWGLEWALGAYVAVAHFQKKRAFPQPKWCALVLLLGLIVGAYFDFAPAIWACTQIGLALTLETFLLSRSDLWGIERGLALIGLWSYSLYLLHVPIIDLCQHALETHGFSENSVAKTFLLIGSSFTLSLLAAGLCYRWIEERSSAVGNECWKLVQKIRASPQAPGLLVRPHVRQEREKKTFTPTVQGHRLN